MRTTNKIIGSVSFLVLSILVYCNAFHFEASILIMVKIIHVQHMLPQCTVQLKRTPARIQGK